MNRRKGIIALLAGIAGHSVAQTPKPGPTGTVSTAMLRKSSFVGLNLVDEQDDAYGISSITVTYKNRRIDLTPVEIMDALENK